MSKTKHTPGPWKFDGENDLNQGFDVAMPDAGVLATAYYDVDRDEYSVSQAEANAWLIAAAPDLLAACQESLRLLEARLDLAEIGDDEKRHLGTLRAVLAKAKGD